MCAYRITDEDFKTYQRDGYLVVPALFDSQEMKFLHQAVEVDKNLSAAAYEVYDTQGGTAKMAIWHGTGDDLYGLVARSERIVNTMEHLLGGEVYHWHSKMTIKEPHTGGAWEWHQDYGYWYSYACLTPDLATCWIAVDRATKENGCLQVLVGSHLLGRIDLAPAGATQSGADAERVEVAMRILKREYCELGPGGAIFFHSNLLHCSGQNKSPSPRRAFLCCYNAARNSPYKVVRHPQYSPLTKVSDAAIKEVGLKLANQDYRKSSHYQVVK